MIKRNLKAFLSKINFELGRNPVIENRQNSHRYIPYPYKAIITISADFELAWAWRFSKATDDPLDLALRKARKARLNIPKILDLCDQNEIPITWATVGHLFLKNCVKQGKKSHPEICRLNYFENNFWKYDEGDWFQHDPCSNEKDNPEWYAPEIIQNIISRKIEHEIGCHTFSHIDCSDRVCPPATLKSEIDACIQEANRFGITLKSFVHPGHTIGNLDLLAELGFTSFRTDNRNILSYPKLHKSGLWEFKQTAEFVYQKEWSINYHIHRYKKIIDKAIDTNTVCYFWFHPSMDNMFVEKIMPEIFSYIHYCKDELLAITTRKYVDWLNEQGI